MTTTTTLTFCSCGGPDGHGCSAVVGDHNGLTLPSHDLADNHVFNRYGGLNYIELFVREHVVGQTLRDKWGGPYVVRSNGRQTLSRTRKLDTPVVTRRI